MRRALLVITLITGCSIYSGDDSQPTPTEADAQCRELVSLFCVAADECGWDANAGPCVEFYGAQCEINRTVVSEDTMTIARRSLSEYECAPNEAWIIFPNDRGQTILDAMLMW